MQSVCTQNLRKPNTGQEGLHLPCVERSVIFSDREGIGKCVCLRLPAVAVNFDAVSASSVFLVYFYPRSWNASEQSKLLQGWDEKNTVVLTDTPKPNLDRCGNV